MKTQILLRKHTPVSIISFLLLLTTTLLGCNTINRALEIDAVLLTLDDLRTMGVRTDKRIGVPIEHLKELHVISAYEQRGTQLTVQYWLFASASAAKKSGGGVSGYGSLPRQRTFTPSSIPKMSLEMRHGTVFTGVERNGKTVRLTSGS